MNCSPSICIAVLLLALTGGTFLLYIAKKENLGGFFKAIAWFVIVVSLGCMICCTVCRLFCCKQKCAGMEQCGPGSAGECGPGKFEKRVMICKGAEAGCEGEMEMGCCKEGKECGEDPEKCAANTSGKCCKEDEGNQLKKDSAAIK